MCLLTSSLRICLLTRFLKLVLIARRIISLVLPSQSTLIPIQRALLQVGINYLLLIAIRATTLLISKIFARRRILCFSTYLRTCLTYYSSLTSPASRYQSVSIVTLFQAQHITTPTILVKRPSYQLLRLLLSSLLQRRISKLALEALVQSYITYRLCYLSLIQQCRHLYNYYNKQPPSRRKHYVTRAKLSLKLVLFKRA